MYIVYFCIALIIATSALFTTCIIKSAFVGLLQVCVGVIPTYYARTITAHTLTGELDNTREMWWVDGRWKKSKLCVVFAVYKKKTRLKWCICEYFQHKGGGNWGRGRQQEKKCSGYGIMVRLSRVFRQLHGDLLSEFFFFFFIITYTMMSVRENSDAWKKGAEFFRTIFSLFADKIMRILPAKGWYAVPR